MRSVQAGVASVMCSYSKRPTSMVLLTTNANTDLINDTYACDNNKTLNDILKREFGFQGYVMSDWSAQHDTMSAVAGLDVRSSGSMSHVVSNGCIDDHARRYQLWFWYFILWPKSHRLRLERYNCRLPCRRYGYANPRCLVFAQPRQIPRRYVDPLLRTITYLTLPQSTSTRSSP